jgi:O-acetyl-ADP-ribose deacetylase
MEAAAVTSWSVVHGDILDQPAEALVCSANPFLTLSGGVGGAFLLRYGPQMQERLTAYLADRGVRHVPPGTVVVMSPCGSPYRVVLHAVAVDGAYDSSVELVRSVALRALEMAAEAGARTVALPALATGYGHLSLAEFAEALAGLRERTLQVTAVAICLRQVADVARVERALLRTP